MPETVRMETSEGISKELVRHDEILVPPTMADKIGDTLAFIKQLPYKPGDVLLCSYPKCGTHWVGSLIRELTRTDENEAYRPSMDILEMTPPEVVNSLATPRMLTTHLRPRRLPKAFVDNRCRIVLVLRNPKDVAVSAFHQLKNAVMFQNQQTWGECLVSFMAGKVPYSGYFDYLDDWEDVIAASKEGKSRYKIELFFYEDLKENTLENVQRLSNFLGVAKDKDELQQVVNTCSIGSLREKTKQENANVPSTLKGSDGYSVLYRKGDVGDWMNHFTVAQNEAFDKLIRSRLQGSVFEFKYE